MKKEQLKPITLTSEQIEILYNNREEEPDDRESVPGFEGWSVDCDTDTGDYDGEKGSMIDYEIYLYNKEGEFIGEAIGGYFNNVSGHQFEDLTFYPPEPETPESKLNDFLKEISDDDSLNVKQKAKRLREYLEKLENT